MCGSKSLQWDCFRDANYSAYKAEQQPEFVEGHKPILPIFTMAITHIMLIHMARQTPGSDNVVEVATELLNLCAMTRLCHCTDPRDKIFSILGIAKDKESLGVTLQPDYSRPPAAIYTDLATQILKAGHLDIIDYCGPSLNIPNLLSWVPDWTSQNEKYGFATRAWRPGAPKTNIYNVHESLPAQISFSPNKRILHLSGFIFDTIQAISIPQSGPLIPADWYTLALGLTITNDAEAETATAYITSGTQAEALKHTLCLDLQGIDTGLFRGGSVPLIKDPQGAYSTMPFRSSHEMDMSTMNCRLLRTGRGYLGLASQEAKVGDKVCILGGVLMPFLLREREREGDGDGGFVIVGQAYVHGIMDGEAVDQFEVERRGKELMKDFQIW